MEVKESVTKKVNNKWIFLVNNNKISQKHPRVKYTLTSKVNLANQFPFFTYLLDTVFVLFSRANSGNIHTTVTFAA